MRVGHRWSAGKTGLLLVAALGMVAIPHDLAGVVPAPPAVVAALEGFIAHEMADKGLPGVAVALVQGREILWARGFGEADPATKRPMTPDTLLRVGSVSKLFTDVAVMQLVERGELDLDAPVTRYLPDFTPGNPFGTPVTLRMLMAHRSGLVREPPTGSYFDPAPGTLADLVRGLNTTALVYQPGTRTKYSNAGIAVVGRVLEKTQGEPFADLLGHRLLRPLGLARSTFTPPPALRRHLASAVMWTYEGRVFPAPRFELGIAPAGGLYSTVRDLARFVAVLLAGGHGTGGPVLKPETLEAMWQPQFARPGDRRGFGLGFNVSEMDGRRLVGHDGAVYGFATSLGALPDDGLGVVVVATRDSANAVTDRVASTALRLLLAKRDGKPLPEPEVTTAIDPTLARPLLGRYARGEAVAELTWREGELYLTRSDDDQRLRVRSGPRGLVVDDVLGYGLGIAARDGGIRIGEAVWTRVPESPPSPPPAKWTDLVGEYGPDHDVLYVLEKDGRLEALIEWFTSYPLTEASADAFQFPDRGLYAGESLRFARDAAGRVTAVSLNGIPFSRRASGVDGAGTFRVKPARPLAASPPHEAGSLLAPDLVDLATLDPGIKLDIRYATGNNFLGTPVYQEARAFLQRPAAEALARAHRRLAEQGFGLLIHDAYRPWYVTKVFWEATPEQKRVFVADPAQGSRHNRGCAVDLTLYRLADGRAVEMPGVYDEMSERSYPGFPGGTSEQRWRRELLRAAMEEEGFTVYDAEWWHFDYRDWRRYPILNLTFDRLSTAGR
jgi:CubicO group peptidase (beta-lactamase class C family)/D-alanyl-D-alanine dipeptidase